MTKFNVTNTAFLIIAVVFCFLVVSFPPNNVFSYDVFGYYMYLPLHFKYHDLTIHNYEALENIINTYKPSETFYQALKWDNGNWVMRYPMGLSILYAPFYFIADLIVPYTKYNPDGFSKPYQLSILYGCLFYTLIGLYYTKKTLKLLFDDNTAAITLIGISMATNYFFHTTIHGQGTMSHNILFTLYSLIIFYTIKWHLSYKLNHAAALGIFIGLTALCRPSEIVSAIIPVLYGIYNLNTFKNKIAVFLQYKSQLFIAVFLTLIIGSFQLLYYKYASGRFFINPYSAGNPGEGLELLHPQFLKVLFSFRKGWFIYTPLMLFVVVGFYQLYKAKKELFLPIVTYTFVSLYIVSSWSCWWFGDCFGNRTLIASYASLSIPLACFFHVTRNNKLRQLIFTLFTFFVVLNLFQSWQMRNGILDAANMSREYYFSTFLQTTPPTEDQKHLLLKGQSNSEFEYFGEHDSKKHYLNYAIIKNYESEKTPDICDTLYYTGKKSKLLISACDSIVVPHEEITKKSYTWIKASICIYSTKAAENLNAHFEIHLTHKNWIFKPVKYFLNSNNFKPNKWNKLEYYYMTPDDLRSTKDKVCIYFYNSGNHPIFIDNLTLQSFEPIIDKSVF